MTRAQHAPMYSMRQNCLPKPLAEYLFAAGGGCGSPKLDRPDHIDISTACKEQSGNMLAILLGWFRLIWLFGRGHHAVVLENLALRQQLAIYKRTKKRPRLVGRDRWFWIALSAAWKDWRRPLFVVHPDTVVRWQRERFRRYWAQRSKKLGRPGRPPISGQVRKFVSNHGLRQSLVACPAHSRGVTEARNRGFGAHRFPRLADREAAAVTDVEDVPPESHRGNRCD
jgi:hypothetical protein